MIDTLFDEFSPVSTKQWKQKIQYELGGLDYNSTLLSLSPEGIHIKPFYTREDLVKTLPPMPPSAQWKITERITAGKDPKTTAATLRQAQDQGSELLHLVLPRENNQLFEIVKALGKESFHLMVEWEDAADTAALEQAISILPENARITPIADPINRYVCRGNWQENKTSDLERFRKALSVQARAEAGIRIVADAGIYANAGAHATQQLAYALSHINEYLNHLENEGLQDIIKRAAPLFIMATGNDYFTEIAKFRALRQLWRTLAEAYQAPGHCFIMAYPSTRNKTIYDYNNNLLRTTTETMSAILGGADYIGNLPYDFLFKPANAFSSRLSRNQLLIMRHEAYLDQVGNPADGSYFVESLTTELAQKALELFQQVEAEGGFLSQLKQQHIQNKILEQAMSEQKKFDQNEILLVGANSYPNPKEKMAGEIEKDPFPRREKTDTQIAPILERRLAARAELKRLKEERS